MHSQAQVPARPLYSIRLEFFSGPMDLLLHLVHQREVSISDVNLAEVCEQYLQIVSDAALLDLDKATEYLVIAATLIAMKSQALLPNAPAQDDQNLDEAFDPRFFSELRERLKAYEMTKLRAHKLVQAAQLGVDTFVRPFDSRFKPREELTFSGDSTILGSAFAGLLKRVGKSLALFKIRIEPVSIVSFMMKVIDRLTETAGAVQQNSFFALVHRFQGQPSGKDSPVISGRGAVIGTLIAVLELVRRGVLTAVQPADNSDIQIGFRLKEGAQPAEIGELSSEFDEEPLRAAVGAEPYSTTEPADESKVVRMKDYRGERLPDGASEVAEQLREANRG